jgi:type II secretory pathway pseudopilin PulG
MSKNPRAFTLIETAAVLACLGVGGVLLAPGQPGNPIAKARESARQIKDSQQLRGIHQSLVLWAQNNKDSYPLPSTIDKGDMTVKPTGSAQSKDTTANIFSVMIYNGFFSPELCISPSEVNSHIKLMKDYAYSSPSKAATPAQALWDPAFAVDFTGESKGNFSYSHTEPTGGRLKKWGNTFQSEEVALCTRTPEIKSIAAEGDKSAKVEYADPKTLTSKIFGHGKGWYGNAVMNDNHVVFVEDKIHDGSTFDKETAPYYVNKDGAKRLDCWCFDEKDDPASKNNYVGIFIKAGATPADFKPIWD